MVVPFSTSSSFKTHLLFCFAVLLNSSALFAQNTLTVVLKDDVTQETIPGATVRIGETTIAAVSNAKGEAVLTNIPNGKLVFFFKSLGYQERTDTLSFPFEKSTIEISLTQVSGQLDQVIVEGTRSNKSIENIPTRVEVLTEEIDEASSMDPSKVAHLLTHSTGIQVQQTSATSNTANVRIQGLDGRYTQILKDGFPLYGGFSGSLSIMQIPPLDLRQVEYIKGSASTLYGGGAISGLINLISKEPGTNESLIHLNASHIGALDVNTFVSRKFRKTGFTLLAQRNSHQLFDADKDHFSDLPQLVKYNINPKLFFYLDEKTTLNAGATFTNEIREGGDITVVEKGETGPNHFYKERNEIDRYTTQLKFSRQLSATSSLNIRNSISSFQRALQLNSSPGSGLYSFSGNQLSTYSELSFTSTKKGVLVSGLNFISERFREDKIHPIVRDEEIQTVGVFSQYTIDLNQVVSVEGGLRIDHVLNAKTFLLPRLFTLFKWTPKLTTRIGGGLGYRNATIFNQESELQGYMNVLAIDRTATTSERSYGSTADIGYKTPLGENFFISFNQMFFLSYLSSPLVLTTAVNDPAYFEFRNSEGYVSSKGTETFFKFGFYDFVLFAGYTFTDVHHTFSGKQSEFTLTPRHSLKGDLLYALPGKWRIAVDYEYKSSQLLSTGRRTIGFWTYGAVVERTIKKFAVYGNLENITNVRQTRYESLLTSPYGTPQFTEVWAPLDGFVFNAGVKIRL